MLNKVSMQSKLIMLSMGISSVGLIVGGFSYLGIKNVSQNYSHISHEVLPDTKALGEMMSTYRRVRIVLRTLGLNGLTKADNEATVTEVKAEILKMDALIAKYKGDGLDPGEDALFDKVLAEWEAFKLVGADVLKYNAQGTTESRSKMLDIFLGACPARAKEFTIAITALIGFQDANAKSWVEKAESSASRATEISLLLCLIGVGASTFVGFVFSRSLSRTLGGVAEKLSQGAVNVSNESSEISNASQSLSSASTEQAAALQQTVASIEEVSSMVAKNAEAAKRGREVAETSNEASIRGQKAVADMIRSISEISESNTQIENQVNASNRDITDIVKVISEIGERTKVINDIVFQTKLLSFNASVEAARAGDHGKGFAVVAEEVGKLAQMSGDAAKEISDMLSASILKVETIVDNTKTRVETLIVQGKTKLEQGTENAQNCAQVLDEIVKNVSEVNSLVGEIATASSEQAQGVHEINRAMSELDQVAQKNTATSQTTASAAESLTGQASDLRGIVSTLLEAVYGEGNSQAVANGAPVSSGRSHSSQSVKAAVKKNHLKSVPKPLNVSVPVYEAVPLKAVGGLPSASDSRFEDV